MAYVYENIFNQIHIFSVNLDINIAFGAFMLFTFAFIIEYMFTSR